MFFRILSAAFLIFFTFSVKAYPITSYLEMTKTSGVSNAWQTLSLSNTYSNPVVACTYNLPSSASNEGAVRVQVVGSSIQVKVQPPQNSSAVTASDVYCTISEEGSYTTPIKYEAHTVVSTQTNNKGAWQISKTEDVTGAKVQTYIQPVVIGQVMTYNNPNFVTFWSSRCNRVHPATNAAICVGKHTGEITVTAPTTETLGYFIAEQAEYTLANAYVKIALGADSVRGVTQSPSYNYALPRSYSYATATISAMDGGDGGWAILYGASPVSTSLKLAIDEDTIGDTERNHTPEQVSYWVMDPILIPELSLAKNVITVFDPLNITTNPKAIPGSILEYSITAENNGAAAADNNSIQIADLIPSNTRLCVSVIGHCQAPYFVDIPLNSGLTLASVVYSNDGGASYSYTASPDAEGTDSMVTNLRASTIGSFLPKIGVTAPSFQLKFRVIVD